jgi:hypothetical protein
VDKSIEGSLAENVNDLHFAKNSCLGETCPFYVILAEARISDFRKKA